MPTNETEPRAKLGETKLIQLLRAHMTPQRGGLLDSLKTLELAGWVDDDSTKGVVTSPVGMLLVQAAELWDALPDNGADYIWHDGTRWVMAEWEGRVVGPEAVLAASLPAVAAALEAQRREEGDTSAEANAA